MGISLPVRNDASAVGAHVHPADLVQLVRTRSIAGARVLFINMPLRETARPNVTPEGPLLLATNLRDNYGADVTIVDLNAYRIKDEEAQRHNLPYGRHLTRTEASGLIQRHMAKHGEPVLVALSGKITTLRWQEDIVKMIRRMLPDVFIVSGGGLATELKAGLFNYIPELDGAAHSEGDDVIIKIVYDAKVIKERGFQNAHNAGELTPYYIGQSGRHRFLYAGDRPRNLNILPSADLELLRQDVDGNPVLSWYLNVPAWSARANNSSAAPFRDEDVVPKTTSVSSRGCPYHCFYCFRKTQGEQNWGERSPEHIMNELQKNIAKYGIKFHAFPDDNFAVTLGRIRGLHAIVPWGTHTRLDEVAGLNKSTAGTAEAMAEAGCKYIGFGPESASASVLQAIGKGGHTLSNGFTNVTVAGRQHSFPRSMVLGIENAHRVGIHGNCTWIVGSPTETLEDVKESVLFMLWQMEFYGNPEAVNTRMFTMTWYPGVSLINHSKVRAELTRIFGLQFQEMSSKIMFRDQWEPVPDNNYYKYLLELDDATKVLENEGGEPLNFSDMDTDTFLKVREKIDSGHTLEILDL